jgi:phospholipid/cholesterol/gamma-HCH transport system permease protein
VTTPTTPTTDPPETRENPKPAALESAVEAAVEDAAQALEEVGTVSVGLVRRLLIATVGYLGEMLVLLAQAVSAARRGVHFGDLTRQLAIIGVDTVPIAIMTVGFTGAVLSLYSILSLAAFGVQDLVGGIVTLSIVRETGPILTGVVLAARAGSAMTAEIGSMKVSEQIDALRSMGISPVSYLVVPRLLAAIITVPLVTMCANLGGVLGGGIFAVQNGLAWPSYLNSIRQMMQPDGSDITKGLIKTMVFGIIVALVGCREGLSTEGGAAGVGQSTTRSVVISIVLIFIANFVLSFTLFGRGLI